MKKILLCALLAAALLCGCTPPSAPPDPPAVPDEQVQQTLQPLPAPEPEPLPEPEPEPAPAQVLLASMTLEEKVGQLFFARCPDADAAALAGEYQLGGYVLFARDFEGKSADQVRADIAACQDASAIPMLIAVDEEGGTVTRVSRFPTFRDKRFPSPQALYAAGGMDAVVSDTLEKCALLSSLGINVNLAPVCDVSTDPADFIYDRSFGQDGEQTAQYVRAVTQVMVQEQMGCALKHFPGYGSNADTHTGIAYDRRPYEQFETCDFLPFRAGIEAGAGMVLVSHNIVCAMDDTAPASLSPAVHDILRRELGFEGVITTDDLSMDGIRHYTDDASAAVAAILAGNDLLLCTDFQTQLPAVLAAVADGTIPESRIDESVLRLLALKEQLGLLQL